jgi:hypothetical protein
MTTTKHNQTLLRWGMAAGIAGLALLTCGSRGREAAERISVIVQAQDAATAAAMVRSVGSVVDHDLGVIDAVSARLTSRQKAWNAGSSLNQAWAWSAGSPLSRAWGWNAGSPFDDAWAWNSGVVVDRSYTFTATETSAVNVWVNPE